MIPLNIIIWPEHIYISSVCVSVQFSHLSICFRLPNSLFNLIYDLMLQNQTDLVLLVTSRQWMLESYIFCEHILEC